MELKKKHYVIWLQEGKTATEMDKITKKMGFPVGSATLMDKVGIDVAAKISEYLGKELGSRLGDSAAMVSILKEMVSKGMLGRFQCLVGFI